MVLPALNYNHTRIKILSTSTVPALHARISMSTSGAANRPLHLPLPKYVELDTPPEQGGNLTPDISAAPHLGKVCAPASDTAEVSCIGPYLLLELLESSGNVHTYRTLHRHSQEEYLCKVLPLSEYRATLAAYWRLDAHPHITQLHEVLLGTTLAYAMFPRHFGDLHTYVRHRRKLREHEARALFAQIMAALACCHNNGVVLRDVKLRKFVFTDADRTRLSLASLEGAHVLEDAADDLLADKHGCPAYVSPEILTSGRGSYSGRAADMWGAGVMLYTLLAGRYPFHDTEPGALFSKIRRGAYTLPPGLSSRARCLVRNLLRPDPAERLRAAHVLRHPWLSVTSAGARGGAPSPAAAAAPGTSDQAVPDYVSPSEEPALFA